MLRLVEILVAGALLLPAALAQSCTYPSGRFTPNMASGYTSQLLLSGLKAPRGIIFDNDGNLLIVESGGGGVRQVKFTEQGGKVCPGTSKTVLSNGQLNHGIALSVDGKKLFVSSSTTVFSYDYDSAAGTTSNQKTLITGMQQGGGHQSRTLLVPQFAPTKLIVSRGSDGNIDTSTTQIPSGKSQIRIFDIASVTATSVPYTQGEVLGWGLRNSVGVAENPKTGEIWSVENSVDDMKRSGSDVHNDNPAEELNYHGFINDTANPLKGKNYGYPDCFSVWDLSKLTNNAGLAVGTQFAIDNPTGGSTDATCKSGKEQAKIVFPSHTAPLDIRFNANGTAAYVSFHGSWDRNPPDGYRVGKIVFGANGMPTSSVEQSNGATQYIMQNTNLNSCPTGCFRPVGLAVDKKGRLFMSSDQSNELYVIYGTET